MHKHPHHHDTPLLEEATYTNIGDGVIRVEMKGKRAIVYLPDWVIKVVVPDRAMPAEGRELYLARKDGAVLDITIGWDKHQIVNDKHGPHEETFKGVKAVHLIQKDGIQEWVALNYTPDVNDIVEEQIQPLVDRAETAAREAEAVIGGPGVLEALVEEAEGYSLLAQGAAATAGTDAAAAANALIAPNVTAAEAARLAAQGAADAAVLAGNWRFVVNTTAEISAITGMVNGDKAFVKQTENVWEYVTSEWVDRGVSPLALKANSRDVLASHNMFDPLTMVRVGFYWSVANNRVQAQAGYKITKRIPVVPGETFFIRCEGAALTQIALTDIDADTPGAYTYYTTLAGACRITIPVDRYFMQINLLAGGPDFTNNLMIARSAEAPVYQDYNLKVREDKLPDVLPDDFIDSDNVFDKRGILPYSRVSTATAYGVNTSSVGRSSGFVKVVPGATYKISGVNSSGALHAVAFTLPDPKSSFTYLGVFAAAGVASGSVTIPAGHEWLFFDIRADNATDNSLDDGVSVVRADIPALSYPAGKGVNTDYLPGGLVFSNTIFELYSKNMLDPTACNFIKRYSVAAKTFTDDTLGIAASAYIPVEEGRFYAVSGDAVYYGPGPQGGFFTAEGATTALDNIVWSNPPTGAGKVFLVPSGLGIKYAVINLRKLGNNPSATSLDGVVQVEEGEMASSYTPYNPQERIKPELIPQGSGGGGGGVSTLDAASWYNFVEADGGGSDLSHKLPRFREKWLKRNADLVVVNSGTSLTARSTEHCTDHPQAAYRPPLMHSMNFATHIWDRLKWEGQQYRRYDAASFFSEIGSWATSTNLAEWDDGAYRHGLTRYSSAANAAVTFTIPVGAWAARFIYRTDSLGCNAAVAVSGGNGKVRVYDEATSAWVEANGYEFSQAEAAPVARNIVVPTGVSGGTSTQSLTSKGNTTYQKRLKMRVVVRGNPQTITVSRTGGGERMMYWGVEWSPREHMVTYINAARGGHNTGVSGSGLTRYQDNEVWSFKPDLILTENPIHNDGAASASSAYAEGYWGWLTERFFFREDFELSMVGSCDRLGLAVPEFAIFTSSIAWNFGGIETDGTLKFGMSLASPLGAARAITALDRFAEAHNWIAENRPDAVSIHAAQRWCDAAVAIHGDMRTATEGSGKSGATFTNEGSHWNDTGSRVMAKAVLPVIPRIW